MWGSRRPSPATWRPFHSSTRRRSSGTTRSTATISHNRTVRRPMNTRREFLVAASAAAGRAAGVTRVEPIATISMEPAYYHGWPTMALRRNGELVVTYSGSREGHVCPFGRLELIRSWDGGAAWSWPQVVMDSPIDNRDAGVLETPAG